MTESSKKEDPKVQKGSELQCVLYIYHSTQFNEFLVKTLIDLGNNINMIQASSKRKLSLCICQTNINAKKIDGSRRKTYKMVIALFQVDDKDRKTSFFETAFLLADISMDVVFEMFFLIQNNIKINFYNQKLKQRLYIAGRVFFTTH